MSFDELLYGTGKMKYDFVPQDINDVQSYVVYAKDLAAITEKVNLARSEIWIAAADIPTFHYSAYNELTLFQIFSWHKNANDFSGMYEDFVKDLNTDSLLQSCRKIFSNYQRTPSTEIWTDHTIDSMLQHITYHFEMEHFKDKEMPILLCNQLMEMMDTLHDWAKKGAKGIEPIPFYFYVNEVDTGNTFVLIENEKQSWCVIRLFTINGLSINEDRFCRVVKNWIDNLVKRSTCVSSSSSKDRSKFFSNQKRKNISLVNLIQAY